MHVGSIRLPTRRRSAVAKVAEIDRIRQCKVALWIYKNRYKFRYGINATCIAVNGCEHVEQDHNTVISSYSHVQVFRDHNIIKAVISDVCRDHRNGCPSLHKKEIMYSKQHIRQPPLSRRGHLLQPLGERVLLVHTVESPCDPWTSLQFSLPASLGLLHNKEATSDPSRDGCANAELGKVVRSMSQTWNSN